MNTNEQILSQCVYDVDNRYVSMYIRPGLGGGFILKMDDTSDDENSDEEVEMFLTNDDLKTIIDCLSERLKP
jgi:hypothetical protein